MTDKNFYLIKYISLIVIGLLTIAFFSSAPSPAERILNIQNYFITVSGIISGIVIAYLATKLFNIKQERERRQIEINKLSDKLTHYRRILYSIMHSNEFWVRYGDVQEFKKQYKGLNFARLHEHGEEKDELRSKFWLDEKNLSVTTVDLYLAMEAIYGMDDRGMTWIFERTIRFNYSIDDLYSFYLPSNQIWYYMEGRYGKHTEGLVQDTSIGGLFRDKVRAWVSQIDNKFRSREFDRHILAEMSTDFYELYIPKLIELTEANQQKLPKPVKNIFLNLVLIFVVGVIFPLFIQCLNLLDNWNIILTLSAVGLIVIGFVNFLFDFYKIMIEEIQTITN